MFINIFKKGHDTLTSGVETWIVQWTKRIGEYSGCTEKCFRGFTNKDEAYRFADSLRRAHALIGNTCNNEVRVYKEQSSGLEE